jgi:integrase
VQLHERLAAGADWIDDDLIISTSTGNRVSPSNFDQTLGRLVDAAGVPRLTSHGLRHTAATHMVRQAADAGELRAVADVLGHSPDMLMKTYAHALPRFGPRRRRPNRQPSHGNAGLMSTKKVRVFEVVYR